MTSPSSARTPRDPRTRATPRPVTDEDRAVVKRLHGEGMSLRGIAKELGRSVSTTQKIANALSLAFDTRPTAAAVRAKVQDNRARRATLVASLYDIAEDDVAYLRDSGTYSLTEVSSGTAVNYMVERLPAQDRRSLVSAISTAAQAAVRLEQVDVSEGAEGAKSMLGDLARGLRAVYLESSTADHGASPEVD